MALEVLVLITKMSYWVAFAALLAITFLFVVDYRSIHESRRSVAVMCFTLTFIAAANYFVMKDVALSATMSETIFPTTVRYTDWALTTPIMLAMFPIMLRASDRGLGLLSLLIILDIIMIVLGYIGETTLNETGYATPLVWIMFWGSSACMVGILFMLFIGIAPLMRNAPPKIRRAIKLMRLYVIVGWSIYPIGFVVAALVPNPNFLLVRELVFNIADVVNKGGFCFIVFWTVRNLPASMNYEIRILPAAMRRRGAY